MLQKKRSAPSLGVCYYPEHWDESRWPDDLRRMRSLGIKFVRVAEFAWSRFEREPAQFSFTWLERFLELVKDEGLAAVVGTPTASPPKWLVDSMPDRLRSTKTDSRAPSVHGGTTVFPMRDIESNANKL